MRAAPTLAVDLRAIAAAVHATGIQRPQGSCVNIWAFLWRIASGLCGETARNLGNNLFSRDEVEKAVNVIHVVNVIQQGSCNVSIGIHHCISNVSCSFSLRWMIGYPSYMAQILMDSAEAFLSSRPSAMGSDPASNSADPEPNRGPKGPRASQGHRNKLS